MPLRKPPTSTEPPIFEGRLLDASEVADRFGMSAQWVRDHAATLHGKPNREPKLVGVKMGDKRGRGVWKFLEADVRDFIRRLREGA